MTENRNLCLDKVKVHSYSKKLLENLDTMILYMESSRDDLLSAIKTLMTVYKFEHDRIKSLEQQNELLQKDVSEMELVRNVLQADLLRFREAYTKEVVRSDELLQEVKLLQSKLIENGLHVLAQDTDVATYASEAYNQDEDYEKLQAEEVITSPDDQHKKIIFSDSTSPSDDEGYTDASKVTRTTEATEVTKDTATNEVSEVPANRTVSNEAQMPEIVSSTLDDASSVFRDSSSGPYNASRLKSSTLSYSVPTPKSTSNMARPCNQQQPEHQFEEMSKIRFNTCQLCKSTIIPLSKYFSCRNCQLKVDRACHDSRLNLDVPCVSKKAQSLVDLVAPDAEPAVPDLISECCRQIEQRGSATERLFEERYSKEVAKLYAKYLASKDVAALKVHKLDIALVSGLLMHALDSLDGPLIGAKWWQDFARASDQKELEQQTELLQVLLSQLAKPNRHTLAFLLLHLKRMSVQNFNTGQSKQSVASLFGPIIVFGSASHQGVRSITKHKQIKLANMQRQIVMVLLELPAECYKALLTDNRETTVRNLKRRTTNYGNFLMNERQRKSFNNNLSTIY